MALKIAARGFQLDDKNSRDSADLNDASSLIQGYVLGVQ